MLGNNSGRLSRAINARLEDPLVNNLSAEGGPCPNILDTSAIIPTWDINQSGMLDPRDKEAEQPSGSIRLANARFTQAAYGTGSVAGNSYGWGMICGPQGNTAYALAGANVLASVNAENTRAQNTKIVSAYMSLTFDAAGAAAFAGKSLTFIVFHQLAEMWGGNAFTYQAFRENLTVGAALTYESTYYSEHGIFIPWDCQAIAFLQSTDGTAFPANTIGLFNALMYTRGKNSMLPMW